MKTQHPGALTNHQAVAANRIITTPVLNPDGTQKCCQRGPLYTARLGGLTIVAESTEPLLEACRTLKERGLTGPVELWDETRPYPRMRLTVEEAARLAASAKAVKAGDLAEVEELLMSQAKALNVMFAELAGRSAANAGQYFDASQRYMSMALKAQNQCRMTLETLSTIKNPPVVYARQANIAHGPQQVNNGTTPTTRAGKSENAPNKLLEVSDEIPLDSGTAAEASTGDNAISAMGEIHGAKV